MFGRIRRWKICAAIVAGSFLTASPASAQTFWTPPSSGNWFNAANWDQGIPNSATAWAEFTDFRTGSQAHTITVDGTPTVGRMTFKVSQFGYTFTGGGITLDNGFSAALIEALPGVDINFQTPLTIGGNGVLTVNSSTSPANGGAFVLDSLTGTNSTVNINASDSFNTYSGVVTIQSGSYGGITNVLGGVLRAEEGTGLSSGTSLRLNGGLWESTQPTTITRTLGTGAGNISLLGTSGFSAYNGPLAVRFNGGGQIQWGSAAFNPATLQFGRGVTATGVGDSYVFENGLDLNGATRAIAIPGTNTKPTVQMTGNLVNTSATAGGLTITGGFYGTVELTGTNTYNGATTVTHLAVLRANEGAGLSPNSNLVLSSGVLEGNGTTTFSRSLGTGPGEVQVTGATSGFSAFGGPLTVRLGGGTDTVVWGSSNFFPNSAITTTLQFGSYNANARTDFQNGIDVNGASRFIYVQDSPGSTADVARISGVISDSTGSAVPTIFGGNGVLELTAANTYNGGTYLTGGNPTGNTLKLVGSGSVAASPTIGVGAGRYLDVTGLTGGANYSTSAGRFLVVPNQMLSGSGTVIGNVLVGAGATIRGGNAEIGDPTGQLNVTGALRLAGKGVTAPASTLAVDLNGATASGATVSRVAVSGADSMWDLAVTGGPVKLQLLNDSKLTLGQPYSYTIGSSANGFTRDGTPVTGYTYGSDFTLASDNFNFSGVSLLVDPSNNLVLSFTPAPVPEPASVLALGLAGLGLVRLVRRSRRGTTASHSES